MAFMKRIQIDLLALGFAAVTMALFADRVAPDKPIDSKWLTGQQARAESALFLDAPPTQARLDRVTGRWAVTDGHTTVWLDARSGELLELELDERLEHPPLRDRRMGIRPADHLEPECAVASSR